MGFQLVQIVETTVFCPMAPPIAMSMYQCRAGWPSTLLHLHSDQTITFNDFRGPSVWSYVVPNLLPHQLTLTFSHREGVAPKTTTYHRVGDTQTWRTEGAELVMLVQLSEW